MQIPKASDCLMSFRSNHIAEVPTSCKACKYGNGHRIRMSVNVCYWQRIYAPNWVRESKLCNREQSGYFVTVVSLFTNRTVKMIRIYPFVTVHIGVE
jgi:hypothetical protein